jgi:hypothetical protein
MLGNPQVSRTPSIIIVYRLSKALYGVKQVLWAWYARLKNFLLDHGNVMESVDKTLFTLKHGNGFLLVKICMDNINFGGSSHVLVSSFLEMMENEFHMSMMGELTFFLGIQVKQTKQGTFIYQDKYTNVIPRSEKEGMKPPYVCPGCSNYTHGNNMINR